MRGEITTRRLQVLLAYLPEGSALHRAQTDGKIWGLTEAIQWQVLGQVSRLNSYIRSWLKIKPHQDKFVWPSTPWEEQEKNTTKYGKVAAEDQDDAVAYLLSLQSGEGE